MNPISSIAVSGLQAATNRAQSAAGNIANRNTTGLVGDNGSYDGYRTTGVTQSSQAGGGVVSGTAPVDPSFVLQFAPSDPNANDEGIVGVPSGSLVEDVTQLALAENAYEANLRVLETADQVARSVLDIKT
jgi:flagellar basal-body rod protein FlgC